MNSQYDTEEFAFSVKSVFVLTFLPLWFKAYKLRDELSRLSKHKFKHKLY